MQHDAPQDQLGLLTGSLSVLYTVLLKPPRVRAALCPLFCLSPMPSRGKQRFAAIFGSGCRCSWRRSQVFHAPVAASHPLHLPSQMHQDVVSALEGVSGIAQATRTGCRQH